MKKSISKNKTKATINIKIVKARIDVTNRYELKRAPRPNNKINKGK